MLNTITALTIMTLSFISLLLIGIHNILQGRRVLRVTKYQLLHGNVYTFTYKHSLLSKRFFTLEPHESELTMYTEMEYYNGKRDGIVTVDSVEIEDEILNVFLRNIKEARVIANPTINIELEENEEDTTEIVN